MRKLFAMMALAIATVPALATDYYLSTTGSDQNDGLTRETAFATLGAAQAKVVAGDNVYILPGTYQITESEISKEESSGPYKIVFHFNHKGQLGKPISFIGLTENGERPVFDMSLVNPAGYRVTAFYVTGCYMVFRNFEVVGIQVNINDHTQSENFRIRSGYRNTFDNIACHDGMGIGFYLTNNAHHNLFLNCDGYNNYDPVSENGKGGQNDAFGCHVSAGNEGNIFIGCRAWNNSDDGFDLINCYSPVTFCYSFAYKNGYDADGNKRQDGNGFKAGGFGMGAAVTLPEDGAPRHEVYQCIATNNKSNGFYSNHHLGGLNFHHNTAYNNAAGATASNFSMVNRQGPAADEAFDVSGYGHTLAYNLSYQKDGRHVSAINPEDGQNTLTGNSFRWENSTWVYDELDLSTTMVSTNVSRVVRDRLADGMLDPATTLTYMEQNSYLGYGADFSGYQDAVREVKKVSGAEEPLEEVVNTYISENRVWDFNDLSEGTVETYADYDGLILRGTAGTHAITTKPGSVWFNANGANIGTSYLVKNKQAADDIGNTTYDRCLAFNSSVAGTTTVVFSASSNNDTRYFQIFFKAKDKEVVKVETVATKAQSTISLSAAEAGSFFIASTIACNVHEVKFEAGVTAIHSLPYCQDDKLNSRQIFNLAGQQVERPQKGLYIVNGKKYVRR